MQPIERYGVIALLLLVVIIAAVVMWDQGEKALVPEPAGPKVAALDGLNRESVAKKAPIKRGARKASANKQPEFKATGWNSGVDQAAERRRRDEAARMLDERLARAQADLEKQPEVEVPSAFEKPEPERAPAKGWSPEAKHVAGSLVEPKPKPVKKEAAPKRTYKVQPGDTMGQIAVDQLGSYRYLDALAKANPKVDPARMTVGTELVLPNIEGAVAKASPTKPKTSSAAKGRSYKVGKGDSLWGIAARELGDGSRYREIAALNPKVDPDALVVGTVLSLPEGAAAPGQRPVLGRETVAQASNKTVKRGVVR